MENKVDNTHLVHALVQNLNTMILFKKYEKLKQQYEKLKQQSEGLYVVRLGLMVQMEGVEWHKDHPDISEDDRKKYELIYKVLEHWFNKVDKAWNGELKLE